MILRHVAGIIIRGVVRNQEVRPNEEPFALFAGGSFIGGWRGSEHLRPIAEAWSGRLRPARRSRDDDALGADPASGNRVSPWRAKAVSPGGRTVPTSRRLAHRDRLTTGSLGLRRVRLSDAAALPLCLPV